MQPHSSLAEPAERGDLAGGVVRVKSWVLLPGTYLKTIIPMWEGPWCPMSLMGMFISGQKRDECAKGWGGVPCHLDQKQVRSAPALSPGKPLTQLLAKGAKVTCGVTHLHQEKIGT